jgi:hypothetical protein
MSSALQIIKEALAQRPDSLAVVTGVNGLSVRLATRSGGIDAVSTVRLSIGDKVSVVNGVATLAPKASVVEAV